MRRRGLTLSQRDARAAYALLSPTLVVVLAVVVIPILATIVFAFERLRLITLRSTGLINGQFTLDNFANAVSASGFVSALTTTITYSVVGTALAIGLGLVAALAVRHPFRGRTIVRGLMLLPYVAPVVAVTFTWRIMLDPNLGIVNAIGTNTLGWSTPIPFLTQRTADINLFGIHFGFPVALATVLSACDASENQPAVVLRALALVSGPGLFGQAADVRLQFGQRQVVFEGVLRGNLHGRAFGAHRVVVDAQ